MIIIILPFVSQVHTDKLQATTRQEQPRRSVLSLLSALVECVAVVLWSEKKKRKYAKTKASLFITMHS